MKLNLLIALSVFFAAAIRAAEPPVVEFTVQLETVMKHDNVGAEKFLWFHPRATAIPLGGDKPPAMLLTIQKHLDVSDYYSGLHVMTREQPRGEWSGPKLPAELDWKKLPDGVTISVADVTPGWHAASGKAIAIGCQVRYSPRGAELDDVRRAHQTVYAVYDPAKKTWTPWRVLELPPDDEFNFARNACSQWIVKPDGSLLVPLYIGKNARDRYSTTVAECRFDGETLKYVRHGSVLRLPVARGLYEPSLVAWGGRYFLTLRNDVRGYVSTSRDGLEFAEPLPWTFDDGKELGSYNTQQHWLAHSDGLFLVYTRRGANNDYIIRHRAPLFMAQIDPDSPRVLRRTEKVVVPERGAELGNFGCNPVSERESWVTVSEGMFMKDSRQRGAEGPRLSLAFSGLNPIGWLHENNREAFDESTSRGCGRGESGDWGANVRPGASFDAAARRGWRDGGGACRVGGGQSRAAEAVRRDAFARRRADGFVGV